MVCSESRRTHKRKDNKSTNAEYIQAEESTNNKLTFVKAAVNRLETTSNTRETKKKGVLINIDQLIGQLFQKFYIIVLFPIL